MEYATRTPPIFDLFDQSKRALLYKLEELSKGGFDNFVTLQVFSQERFFRASISDTSYGRPPCAGGVVVQKLPVRTSAQVMSPFSSLVSLSLLSASGLAFSRNFACQLLETFLTLPHLSDRTHLWRRAPDHRFLVRTHSRRALGAWRKAQKSSNLGLSIDLRGSSCVTCFCKPRSAEDQCICDSSRNCDPTSPGGSLQNVTGAQKPWDIKPMMQSFFPVTEDLLR